MVVLLTPAALHSESVKRDIEYAIGQLRLKERLIPVVVRPVAEIPWILETLKVLRIDSNPEAGGKRVAQALKRLTSAA